MQPARFKLHAEERTCNPVLVNTATSSVCVQEGRFQAGMQ
jgi:hypothetical protein